MKKTLLILFIIGLISAAGIYYFNSDNKPVTQTENNNSVNEKNNFDLYNDSEFGYSIKIPKGYKVENEGKYSKRFMPDKEIVGMGPANFIYVSVVTPEVKNNVGEVYNYDHNQFEKLITLENIGDSINLVERDMPDLSDWYTYSVVAIEDIDRGKIKNFENTKPWEFPSGTTENKFIYGTEKNIYILGYYTGGDSVTEDLRIDPRIAYEVIKSFKINR